MKKIRIAATLLALLALTFFLMTGCSGNKEGAPAENNAPESSDASLENVLNKGEFVLGLDDSFPPMGYRDENDEIVGFDIDVATEVCARLGVSLKLQPIEWAANELELNSGNIDCIWNGMSVNPARAETMNLSEPYMKNRMVFVVKKDSGITDLAGLEGKAVAVQNGSTAQTTLEVYEGREGLAEVVDFADNVTAFMDLEADGVQAVFLDEIVAGDYITRQQKDFVILDEALSEEDYAIGFRKGDQALRDAVQQALSDMNADGKLAEISVKWFGKDITTVQ